MSQNKIINQHCHNIGCSAASGGHGGGLHQMSFLMAIKMNTCMLEMIDLWDALLDGDSGICAITCTHGIGHLASTLCLGRWRLYLECTARLLCSAISFGFGFSSGVSFNFQRMSHLLPFHCLFSVHRRSMALLCVLNPTSPTSHGWLQAFVLGEQPALSNRNWIRLWAVCLGLLMTDRLWLGSARVPHLGWPSSHAIETCLRPSALSPHHPGVLPRVLFKIPQRFWSSACG